jgi:hypothetical protein
MDSSALAMIPFFKPQWRHAPRRIALEIFALGRRTTFTLSALIFRPNHAQLLKQLSTVGEGSGWVLRESDRNEIE